MSPRAYVRRNGERLALRLPPELMEALRRTADRSPAGESISDIVRQAVVREVKRREAAR